MQSSDNILEVTLIQDRNLDDVSSKRGLRKICNEVAKLPGFTKAKEPRFRLQATSFYTELLNNNYKGEINDPVNDPVKLLTLLQKDLIALLRDNPTITRPELVEHLNVSLATIRRTLAQLKDLKLIERIGSDKTGYWEVKESGNMNI